MTGKKLNDFAMFMKVKIRGFRDRKLTTIHHYKTGFKHTSNRLRKGNTKRFNRHVNCAIPYNAKYYMKT